MLSEIEYEFLWERELRDGHAYDFAELKRAIERRVDNLIEEWAREETTTPCPGTIPLDVLEPDIRRRARKEVASRAGALDDLDGPYEEDLWFDYQRVLKGYFDPIGDDPWVETDDGDLVEILPWEEPRLTAARTLVSTVPFSDYNPSAEDLGC
ncbi:hypothetical protein [Corynebacterium sp. UBA2622]|uniref:hypothetical protein n=1 Tax=Corynebacterium sp. UBA2622 TaxID=1946393 RepID=UPI0025C5BBDB|nr:hypothetical protein [Corynebacterium sp. UBA2622]